MNVILRDMSKGYTPSPYHVMLFIHSLVPFSCLEPGLNFWGGSSHDVSIKCSSTWQGFRVGWLWKISTIPLESVCHRNRHDAGVLFSCGFEAGGDKRTQVSDNQTDFSPVRERQDLSIRKFTLPTYQWPCQEELS